MTNIFYRPKFFADFFYWPPIFTDFFSGRLKFFAGFLVFFLGALRSKMPQKQDDTKVALKIENLKIDDFSENDNPGRLNKA